MQKIIDASWTKQRQNHKEIIWKEGELVSQDKYPFFNIDRQNHTHPSSGQTYAFYRFVVKEWAGIFAMTKEEKLVVIEQYRFGNGEVTLEVPGGVIDAGEKASDAVLRELEEESGYVCDPPVHLGSLATNPALLNNQIHFYYGANAVYKGAAKPDATECINSCLIAPKDFDELVNKGEVRHALIVAGFLLFKNLVLSKK